MTVELKMGLFSEAKVETGPLAVSEEMEEYERGPAPSFCPQMKTSRHCSDSCQYFTALLSFAYHISYGVYKLQHTGARLGGPCYTV